MYLQAIELKRNIFNISGSFFIELYVIYDSNMWVSTFFFSALYYMSFIIFSKNKPKI